MIVDGNGKVLGKLAAFVAKKALLGENVDVINAEKVIITGSKKDVLEKYTQRRERGTPSRGPFFPREPHLIVKRAIRGMLPYKQPKGAVAFKRVKCYKSVPEKLKDKKADDVKIKSVNDLKTKKYVTVEQLSKLLGAK
ncbi:50S ribosomal protein L13 [Candidatus Woesearchaeota archaeon]|nr:MAG: 50S ribosomal protein L13 [Candidatus Woesearchaeota archaeon]